MTKQEAYKAMEDGHKVTHEWFSFDEYVYIKDDKMYTEDGYRFEDGWEDRKTDDWQTGWRIFN